AAVATRPPAVPDASWSAGRPVPERTLLWLSWRFGRAHFGHVRVNGRRGLRSGSGALPQAGSRATLPVTFGGRTLAAVLLEREAPRAWPPAEQDALSSLADHLALALENARIVSRTRELARLEERQRLSRDLHDAVSQNLFSLSMLLAAGREHLHAGQHAAAGDALEEAERRARTALQEMRRLVQELRLAPAGPRYAGELKAALAGMVQSHPLAGRVGTEVRFVTGPLDESALMGEAAFEALVRVTQEAVHNALKHGAPRLVRVRLAASGGGLALSVRDDGAGFDVRKARTSGGQGLSIMGERCRLAGGRLRLRSRPGAGTLVSAWVPTGGPGGDGAVFAASGAVV
ncbi:MAG: GAF domain-containing sensor histidine kinase, partial [Bacillota bacterium]